MDGIEVINYDEMPDGSAVVTLELPPEAVAALVQQGFNKVMEECINATNQTECNTCSCDSRCGEDD